MWQYVQEKPLFFLSIIKHQVYLFNYSYKYLVIFLPLAITVFSIYLKTSYHEISYLKISFQSSGFMDEIRQSLKFLHNPHSFHLCLCVFVLYNKIITLNIIGIYLPIKENRKILFHLFFFFVVCWKQQVTHPVLWYVNSIYLLFTWIVSQNV